MLHTVVGERFFGGCAPMAERVREDMPALTLREWVRRRRHACGWTQEELGTRIGADQTTVSNIERGATKESTRATLQKLAAAFGVTYAQLLQETGLADREPGDRPTGSRHKLVTDLEAAPEVLQELDDAGFESEEVLTVLRTMARAGRRRNR